MKIKRGYTALVTGASRGLGVRIARSFARRGVNMVLAARSKDALERIATDIRSSSACRIITAPLDIADHASIAAFVDDTWRACDGIDILVNNAGIEATRRYDLRPEEEIRRMIAVNLTGPMLLVRQLLPRMIERGRGHIVNIASVGGLMPSAYEEPYAATKYGLVGFTKSLRLTAQDCRWPVSASVICPGFMEGAGIYEDMKAEFGVTAPKAMGTMSAETIGTAVIQAIERDLPDVVLMRGMPRVTAAFSILAPRMFETLVAKTDAASAFRKIAEQRG